MAETTDSELHPKGAPPGYGYFWRGPRKGATRAGALQTSRGLIRPTVKDPDYLAIVERRRILGGWFNDLPQGLRVLDLGGRLQPWRELLTGSIDSYVALDPIPEGLVDVVGVGGQLPFANHSFDLVLCTQALGYVPSPERVCKEVHRVLATGGVFILTVPALLPRYHDCRWLFMPDGLESLLDPFERVEIVPEGSSIPSLFRLLIHFCETLVRSPRTRSVLARSLYPMFNIAGRALGGIGRSRSEFTANYCCRAVRTADSRARTV